MDNRKVKAVVEKVRVLRELTEMTGTITKKSQGLLLQSLTSEELILAAQELTKKDGQINDNTTHNYNH